MILHCFQPLLSDHPTSFLISCGRNKDVTKTGNGERGTGNGERGTGNGERGAGSGERVWERVVSGNLHKNSIWPMIDDREPSKQT